MGNVKDKDYTPRAEDLTLEDMAKWMDECAKKTRVTDEGLAVGERRFLTSDLRKGYKRIAEALRELAAIKKNAKKEAKYV